MQYDVPFVSQYADLGHHEWRARGCGIASLTMVMDFYGFALPLDDVLQMGLAIGAYRDGIGWTHSGLVNVARKFGYDGYNIDLAPQGPTPKTAQGAWDIFLAELQNGPVLASVYSGFDSARMGGHIVVVTGFEDGLVRLCDPEEMNEREGRKAMALGVFLKAFKRRYITIRPRVERVAASREG